VGIICCLGVGIGGVDGIGGIREGVLIGWRSVGISGISGVDGIGGIRKGDINSWRGLFVSMCVGVINGDACGTLSLSCNGTSS